MTTEEHTREMDKTNWLLVSIRETLERIRENEDGAIWVTQTPERKEEKD